MGSSSSSSMSDEFCIIQSDGTIDSPSPIPQSDRNVDNERNVTSPVDDEIEYVASPASIWSFDTMSPSPSPIMFPDENEIRKLSCLPSTHTASELASNPDTVIQLSHSNLADNVNISQSKRYQAGGRHSQSLQTAPNPSSVQHVPGNTLDPRLGQRERLPSASQYDYFEQPDLGPPGSGVLVPMTPIQVHQISAKQSVENLGINHQFGNHVELDSLIWELLVEHALNARNSSINAHNIDANIELKHSMLMRLMQLPLDHPIITKFSEDMLLFRGRPSYHNYFADHEARRIVYRQVFTDVERVALRLLTQVHDRHFTNLCQLGDSSSMSSVTGSRSIAPQTRNQGQEVARYIHDRCFEHMSSNDITRFVFEDGAEDLKKSFIDALYGICFVSLMYRHPSSPNLEPRGDSYDDNYDCREGLRTIFESTLWDLEEVKWLAGNPHHCDSKAASQLTVRLECPGPEYMKAEAKLFASPTSPRLESNDSIPCYNSDLREHTLHNFVSTTSSHQYESGQAELGRASRAQQAHKLRQAFVREDYQMQLMLLEQQNKKRLLKAREAQKDLERQRRASNTPQTNIDQEDRKAQVTSPDCHMQLMMLKEQNRKRLLLAKEQQEDLQRRESAVANKQHCAHEPESPQRRNSLIKKEMANCQYTASQERNLPAGCAMALPIRPAPSKSTMFSTAGDNAVRNTDSKGRVSKEEIDAMIAQAEKERIGKNLPRLRKDTEGRPWLVFEYTSDNQTLEYTIRCDLACPELDRTTSGGSDHDNLYYQPIPSGENRYRLNLRLFDLATQQNVTMDEVRDWGRLLIQLNPLLRGKLVLLTHVISNLARAKYHDGTEWSPKVPYVKTSPLDVEAVPPTFSASLALRPGGDPGPTTLDNHRLHQRSTITEEQLACIRPSLEYQLSLLSSQGDAVELAAGRGLSAREQAQARVRQEAYEKQKRLMQENAAAAR